MAINNLVCSSDLKGKQRIDAERYDPLLIELEEKLEKSPNVTKLKYLLSEPVKTGKTPPDRELVYDDIKIHFIKTDILRNGRIEFENSDFLPARKLNDRNYLKPKDVVVTIIGAHYNIIGRTAIFLDDYPSSAVNQNIAVITLNDNYINPFFFMVFLNSKYGKRQLWMLSRQTEQVNLNCREVEDVLVPLLDGDLQEKIEKTVKQFSKLIDESKDKYKKAEKLLIDEIGFSDFNIDYKIAYPDMSTRAFLVDRLDAEYFQPFYDQIIKKIKEYENGYDKLLNLVENVNADFTPSLYPDKTFSYVELADIDSSIGIIDNSDAKLGKEAPSRARRILLENDVIVSTIEGSLDKVALVNKQFSCALASNGFFQFRCIDLYPEVLLILSKSILIQSQLKRACSGTILTAAKNDSLKKIILPILPEDICDEIKSLIISSHTARQKADELMREAIKTVERAIEDEIDFKID